MLSFFKSISIVKVGFLAHLFFAFSNVLNAQNCDCSEAFSDITSLRLELGRSKLPTCSPGYAGQADYLANYADFLELLLGESPTQYQHYALREKSRIKAIQQTAKDSPYHLFLQAEMQLQGALINLKFGNEWKAVWRIRTAYKLLTENKILFPAFTPQLKSLGLLQALLGMVPQQYHWAINFMGMEGNTAKGIAAMQKAADEHGSFQNESIILLAMLDTYLMEIPNTDASTIEKLIKEDNKNLLYYYLGASWALKQSNNILAGSYLQKAEHLQQEDDYSSFPYLKYMQGQYYLQKLHFEEAISHYQQFLAAYKGENFIKDTYHNLCKAYYLIDDPEYEQAIAATIAHGVTRMDADKQALSSAKKGFPSKTLVKIRLLADGGYYEKALQLYNAIDIDALTADEKLELRYRIARIHHQTGNLEAAKVLYEETIRLQKEENAYFAANAALQMGYIYREQQQYKKASDCFEQALTYKNHPYVLSIESKARAAINDLPTF